MSSAGAKFLERLLEQRRMILSLAFMLSLAGVASWFLMIRQEDPFFPYRAGTIITPFPGSDPARIERLVVKPLEEELAQIEEIEDTWSRIRTNVALTTILLKDHVYDTDAAWDKVRRAIKTAQLEYPDGVLEPELDDKVMDASTVVFAVTGSGDPIELLNAARKVKQRLYKIDGVSRIDLFGEPGEQLNVLLRDADANRLNMSPQMLASQLQSRNELVPGGSVRVAGKSATLRPNTEFTSIDEIRRTPIQLGNGEYLPLEAIAEVRYGPKEPSDEEFWWNSQRAVGISLVAIPNKVNSVAQGDAIRQLLPALRAEIAPLEIHEMFFQPDRVKNRLQELSGSLLSGVFIVAGVLFFFMGLRLGLVVASIVPLVTFTAVAVYSMGGGVLHQVAVIGMVVALGMLVDNAIVMGENIQYRLDAGDSPTQAAATSVKELAAPLGTATGTTLAAFVPMLMSNGNAADFTRGIPVMVMLTLTISYFFAVLVTPILASWGLRANPKSSNSQQPGVWERIGKACGNLAVQSPWAVVIAAVVLVLGSGAMMQLVHKQFFPYADRNQLLIEVALPEGTHLDLTRERMSQIEGEVSLLPPVESVYSFVGTTGPRFYYNLPTLPRSPNKGRLVVITESHTQVPELMAWVREYALGNMPDTEVVPRQLGQGPPITAPVEIRVYAEQIANLETAVEQVYEWMRQAPGAVDVRHDLGVGVPSLKFGVNDAVAMRYGHSRQDVATTLLGRTQGIEIGQYRAGDDPVPIKIRSRDGENFPVEQLPSVNVYGSSGPAVPLMQMSNIEIEWQPGAILRRDFSRYATVSANLEDGYGHEQVLGFILPKISEAQADGTFAPDVTTALGGEADASGDANSALLGAAPIGLMMLLFFLLLEFNSFRRVLIIMATVPLVMIGVIPGLVITGSPFGFNSMVGCIALVGIVVNNAIVLIDVIDVRLKEGGDLGNAIREAVSRRTRPIILTTFTTVAGLSPLTITSATAWPPMAWAIISGLLASTVLTLVVIPALCKILLQPKQAKPGKAAPAGAAAVIAMAVIANMVVTEPSYALGVAHLTEDELQNTAPVVDYEGAQNFEQMQPISLLDAIRMASERPAVRAELARTHARKHEAKEAFRRVWLPSLSLTAYGAKADRESNVVFPPMSAGAPPTIINVAERERYGGTVELRQTLFDAANGIYRVQAAKLAAQAQGLITFRQGELATTQSSPAFLQALSFEAQLESARAALSAQALQLKDAESLAKTGRLTDADLQMAKVQWLQIEHHLHELESEQRINLSNFARAIGSPVLRKPVLPVDQVWNQIHLPSLEEAYEHTRDTREDLRAQRLQIRALEKQRAAVGAEALPSLGLAAQYTRNEGQTFQAEEEAWVGAQLSWQIAAGGARLSKRQAIANEYAAVKQELLESERTLWFDLLEAAEHFDTAHEQVALLQQAVAASQAALNNQRKRQKAGLASSAVIAQATAQADEQLANLRRAKIAVIGHWLHFHVVMGSTVEEALNKYGPGIEALEQAM